MSHQFKPGDLALIVRCAIPSEIGKSVEIAYEMPPGCPVIEFAGRHWVNPFSERIWIVSGELLLVRNHAKGRYEISDHAAYMGGDLMPLRGDFEPEQQKAKEVEPCA